MINPKDQDPFDALIDGAEANDAEESAPDGPADDSSDGDGSDETPANSAPASKVSEKQVSAQDLVWQLQDQIEQTSGRVKKLEKNMIELGTITKEIETIKKQIAAHQPVLAYLMNERFRSKEQTFADSQSRYIAQVLDRYKEEEPETDITEENAS